MPRARTVDEVAEDVEQLTTQVQRLADRLDNAPFVRADLHNEQIGNIRDAIAAVRALQMWILGLLGTMLVALGVVVITAVAQGRLG